MSIDLFIWSKQKLASNNERLLNKGFEYNDDGYYKSSDDFAISIYCQVIDNDMIIPHEIKAKLDMKYQIEINFMGNISEEMMDMDFFNQLAEELEGVLSESYGMEYDEIYPTSIPGRIKNPIMSTYLTVGALAIGMAVLVFILIFINPGNKSLSELLPVVIMCSLISLGSVGFVIFLIWHQKKKEKAINPINSFHKEELLWQGAGSVIGGIMFVLKICGVLLIVMELIVVLFAIYADTGLDNKLLAFLIFQIPIIILLAMIFIICSIQASKFNYQITTERIILYYGMDVETYRIRDIIDIKVQYGFWEKNKLFGSLKVKVNKRRIAPLKNQLYSIFEPEKVADLIRQRKNEIDIENENLKILKN